MIYTVTFNPALDYVVRMDNLRLGQTNRTRDELLQAGGKGINVSTVLHELGLPTVAWGFAAGFTGEALALLLKDRGVPAQFIRLPTGLTRINVKLKGEQETELNGSGPNIPPEALDALLNQLEKLKEGDSLVLAGSIPKGLPDDIYQQMLARLQGRGILTVVDAAGSLLEKVLPYRPFLIKPNRQELMELFGLRELSPELIFRLAARLQERGARNVLVSLAGEGAVLLDETGKFHQAASPGGQVRNSVGAGDSMVAGFLAGWLSGGDYSAALRLGIAAGAATTFSTGLATKAEIEILMEAMP